jgi:hypothetical protein
MKRESVDGPLRAGLGLFIERRSSTLNRRSPFPIADVRKQES